MTLLRLGLFSLVVFLFQNCGSFEARETEDIYTYSSQPDFFYDLKLVSVETDSTSRQRYVFDLAMSYAPSATQAVSYRVAFSTLGISRVCLSIDGTADEQSKHIRFQCLLPAPDDLFIELTLVGPESETLKEQFRF